MAVSLFLVESDFHGFEMKAFWALEGLLPIVQNGVRLTALPQGISQSSAHCYFLLSTPLSKKDVCYLLNQLYGAYPEKHKCVKLLSREAGKIRTLNARQCHSCCLTKFSFPRKLGLSWGWAVKGPQRTETLRKRITNSSGFRGQNPSQDAALLSFHLPTLLALWGRPAMHLLILIFRISVTLFVTSAWGTGKWLHKLLAKGTWSLSGNF